MATLDLFRREAMAYLRLGLTAHRAPAVRGEGDGAGPLVLFVPGVGANGAHFLELKEALQATGVTGFDSFEYPSLGAPRALAAELRAHLDAQPAPERVILVGHSLGGVLAAAALQLGPPPSNSRPLPVAALVTIGSPLHGTWRSRFSPWSGLRELRPDSEWMTWLASTRDRLRPVLPRTLTVAAERDQMIHSAQSALLDGARQLQLSGVAHAGLMFDRRVHEAIADLVREVSPGLSPLPSAWP